MSLKISDDEIYRQFQTMVRDVAETKVITAKTYTAIHGDRNGTPGLLSSVAHLERVSVNHEDRLQSHDKQFDLKHYLSATVAGVVVAVAELVRYAKSHWMSGG